MDCGFLIQFSVLNVLIKTTSWVNTEDVQEASVIVEWVAIDVIRWFFASKDEYSAGFGVGVVGLC